MNGFDFRNMPEIDNESRTAFAVMFFKETGKYCDAVYYTADATKPTDSFTLNATVRKFVTNYDRYRGTNAVIIPGERSMIVPHFINAAERR